jgi:putative ABC transport system permease protein
VADALRQEDPELALRDLRTLEAIRLESIALPRFRTMLVMVFGALALLLVVLGVYGVMAYAASLRKQELAIRSALGAQRRHLTGLFLGQGMRVALLGTLLGVVLAAALSRLLSSLVFGVDALDPLVMLGIIPVLVGSVLMACLLPARRAARADPASAMRGEAGR